MALSNPKIYLNSKGLLFILALVTVQFLDFSSCDFTQDQIDYFRSRIESEFIPSNNIPGVGFAIFQDGNVYSQGYGFKNLENLIQANDLTNFAVASVTKSFTSTVVARVLQQKFPSLGAGVLNEPIVNLLPPGYNFTLSDRYRTETVSFRDLLAHRACLDAFVMARTFGAISTPAEFAHRTRYIKEICPFRTAYKYNNGMYGLVGDLIGAISGSSFYELAQDLRSELGMNDTLIISPDLEFDYMSAMSRGYYRRDGTTLRYNSQLLKRMSLTLPSGGLVPTPKDMLKYLEFHLNFGKLGTKQIVPASMMRQLHKPSIQLDFGIEDTTDPDHVISDDYAYGLGLRLGVYKNWAVSSHEGTWPPFRSRLSLYPALKIGIFTVTNGPGTLYGMSHQELHESFFDKLIQLQSSDVKESQRNLEPAMLKPLLSAVSKPIEIFESTNSEELAGIYGHPVQGIFSVTWTEQTQQLYFRYGQWGTGLLEKVSENSHVYNVAFDSDVVGDFLSSSETIPTMTLRFGDDFKSVAVEFSGETTTFVRDATLDTFPPQPWSPDSCSPSVLRMSK